MLRCSARRPQVQHEQFIKTLGHYACRSKCTIGSQRAGQAALTTRSLTPRLDAVATSPAAAVSGPQLDPLEQIQLSSIWYSPGIPNSFVQPLTAQSTRPVRDAASVHGELWTAPGLCRSCVRQSHRPWSAAQRGAVLMKVERFQPLQLGTGWAVLLTHEDARRTWRIYM